MMLRALLLLACVVLLPSSASAQAAATFRQTAESIADSASYTFSAQNVGTAFADRFVVVTFGARATGVTALTLDSLTICGEAATITQQVNQATNSNIAAIAIAAVPTGATCDVVATLSRSALRATIALYTVSGIASVTAHDTANSTATDPSSTLDIPANGVAIGVGVFDGGTATWTGLTETAEEPSLEAFMLTTAHDEFGTTQTGLAITVNGSNSTNPVGVFVSWGPPAADVFTQTFLQTAESSTDTATYTYAAQNLGTADAGRCIIAAVHSKMNATGGVVTITSVTINGVAATIPVQLIADSGTGISTAALAIAAVPTDTSGDVVVVYSAAQHSAGLALWATDGLTCSDSPTDTATSSATNPTANLNVPANGFLIGACSFAVDTATSTWTGVTERYDDQVSALIQGASLNYSGASDDFASAQAGLTTTCDSTSTLDPAGVFASWGPEDAPDPPTDAARSPGLIGGGVF